MTLLEQLRDLTRQPVGPTYKAVHELCGEAASEIERMQALLLEARDYISRARISHLGVDPIISKHNEKCLDLMKRIDAELA